ncbi:hypothetical protein CYLTODRAFT_487135 [Cylindrobasidium torrendii FP15055 ss-10]|uniref:F-box domain-containing protein n=1 Tax=Cylindrobasidium torrendii FP15055 ss-10 TaxID=1314674 RepID=A0A0D7BLU4_9AGAR|nr:hypothetical protein CYLTODRAFT_487135 [Cylindrobasidium torrendii FP15055 ss-10]
MSLLSDLPPETLEEILLHADPRDISQLSRTSSIFYRFIYCKEDHLWRWLFMQQELDDPRECVNLDGTRREDREWVDWKLELQTFIRARTILQNRARRTASDLRILFTKLIELVECVPPRPLRSRNIEYVISAVLADTQLLTLNSDGPWDDQEARQLQAKLHTYIGPAVQEPDGQEASLVRARAFVYDFRNYTWGNGFGPFHDTDSGKVNWVHMRAIQQAMAVHTHPDEEDVKAESGLPLTQVYVPPGEEWACDWAGLNGVWQCKFCFCDHLNLAEYNSSVDEERDPVFFEDASHGDVCRAIDINVRVLSASHDPRHPRHPRLTFGGHLGISMSATTVSGYVTMTDEGYVRWHFRSGEPINPIWSSEGVQLGGIGSRYGVLGSWTTSFHDLMDPVGPFWMRKLTEPSQSES